MLAYQKIIVAVGLSLPVSLLAQNTKKEDSLQGGFLQTVVISYYNNNADFYGHRYDGQAKTERLLDNIPGINLISRGNFAQGPVLCGMSGGQINVTIDNMHIFGACTARMDPVTSYVEPNNMKSLQITSGPDFGNGGATIGGGMNFDLTTLGGYGNAIFIFSLVFLLGLLVVLFVKGQDKIDINKHFEHRELPVIAPDVA